VLIVQNNILNVSYLLQLQAMQISWSLTALANCGKLSRHDIPYSVVAADLVVGCDRVCGKLDHSHGVALA
jgi:hypothetical protein